MYEKLEEQPHDSVSGGATGFLDRGAIAIL